MIHTFINSGLGTTGNPDHTLHFLHERYDGFGYTKGLAGDKIPIEARIFAIVDVFDALLEKRPYRDPLPMEEVLDHFEHHKGVLYDPAILDVFIDLIKNQPPNTDFS